MDQLIQYGGIDTSQFRGHPVDLEIFTGPLDLLLHLIQKDRIEIWEISISRITQQYLEHLQKLEALNVEIAGEFLVMAATLMRMKSQMLLPRPASPEEDGDGMPLTREGLIQKLLEYRRYREASHILRDMEEQRRRSLPRGWAPELARNHMYPLREASVVDLATYLREVLERPTPIDTHEVQLEEIKLEEKIEQLLAAISARGGPVLFRELITRSWWRLEWIVTFLALLELMRLGKAMALQEEALGELWVLAAPPAGVESGEGAVGAQQGAG